MAPKKRKTSKSDNTEQRIAALVQSDRLQSDQAPADQGNSKLANRALPDYLPTSQQVIWAEQKAAIGSFLMWFVAAASLTCLAVYASWMTTGWLTLLHDLAEQNARITSDQRTADRTLQKTVRIAVQLGTVSKHLANRELHQANTPPIDNPAREALEGLQRTWKESEAWLDSRSAGEPDVRGEREKAKIRIDILEQDNKRLATANTTLKENETTLSNLKTAAEKTADRLRRELESEVPDPDAQWCVALLNVDRASGYDATLFERTILEFHAMQIQAKLRKVSAYWGNGDEHHMLVDSIQAASKVGLIPSGKPGITEKPDAEIEQILGRLDQQRAINIMLIVSSRCPIPVDPRWRKPDSLVVHVCCLTWPSETANPNWREFCNSHGGGCFQEIVYNRSSDQDRLILTAGVRRWLDSCLQQELKLKKNKVKG